MKLIKYLKPYWYFALLTPITMIIEVAVEITQPKLMSKIIDQGVLGGNLNIILMTGLFMILLLLIGGLGGVGSAIFAGITSQSFGNDLRADVFSHVMHLSFEQTDKFTTGSLVTRLTNDISAMQEMVAMSLRLFVRSGFMFLGSIIMMLTLNINFGLVLICSLPIQAIVLYILITKASPYFSLVQKKLDNVNGVVQENVSGARVVKAYVREEYENERFAIANNDLMSTNLRVQRIMATLSPVLMIVMNLSVIFIILIGGLGVEAKHMGVGQVMAAITYITQVLMSIMMVSMVFQSISRAKASAQRITEVLETKPVIVGGNYIGGRGDGSISFENVSFCYPNTAGRPVLSNINLNITGGETVAILGATGSGKTSIISLIPRFYDFGDGTIKINGKDILEYDIDNLRCRIGMVLQNSELFSGTIMDNIKWGNEEASDEEAIEAAKIAQADEFIQSFNKGYETKVEEKGASLSGGQKQRLSITRAILKKPEVLIFDDSTSALDLGTETRLQKSLKENLKGTTIIMIAQRIASVMRADKIIVIDKGSIVATGKHEDLLKTSPIYIDIYNSQTRRGDDNE